MIKTIKVKKKLRLDELIKYVWDNAIYPSHFESHAGFKIHFDSRAGVKVDNDYVHSDATVFAVEVEEPITEDTRIPKTVTLTENDDVCRSWNNSIIGLKRAYPNAVQIYAIVDGKLQLIWEDN